MKRRTNPPKVETECRRSMSELARKNLCQLNFNYTLSKSTQNDFKCVFLPHFTAKKL